MLFCWSELYGANNRNLPPLNYGCTLQRLRQKQGTKKAATKCANIQTLSRYFIFRLQSKS